jgi:hypothetical protein
MHSEAVVFLKHGVPDQFRRFSKYFYATGIERLIKGGKSCADNEADLCKNNINFVKDVTIINVNFIINVTVVSEKKQETLLSYRPS